MYLQKIWSDGFEQRLQAAKDLGAIRRMMSSLESCWLTISTTSALRGSSSSGWSDPLTVRNQPALTALRSSTSCRDLYPMAGKTVLGATRDAYTRKDCIRLVI